MWPVSLAHVADGQRKSLPQTSSHPKKRNVQYNKKGHMAVSTKVIVACIGGIVFLVAVLFAVATSFETTYRVKAGCDGDSCDRDCNGDHCGRECR